jgi:phosphoglucosamine mutase
MAANETVYRCPGEHYEISRAVHLGRLAAFYEPCRGCPHRDDTGTLAGRRVQAMSALEAHSTSDLFRFDCVEGTFPNRVTPHVVRQLGLAFASWLAREAATSQVKCEPAVVVAHDARLAAPEIVAGMADALRSCGFDCIEAGAATSGVVTFAIREVGAAGGVIIHGAGHAASRTRIKFWGAGGKPVVAGGALDQIAAQLDDPPLRNRRTFGRARRGEFEAAYLARLRERFHALRPLRIVLDTVCRPFVQYLDELSAAVACQFVPLVVSAGSGPPRPAEKAKRSANPEAPAPSPDDELLAKRRRSLSAAVRRRRAHVGLWVDGDGEACRLIDEQGRDVASAGLLVALARDRMAQSNQAPSTAAPAVVVAQGTPDAAVNELASLGYQVRETGSAHESIFGEMCESGAVLGGGDGARIWLGDGPPRVDALELVSLLLSLLSRSDRPLSQVASLESGTCDRTAA